MKKGLLQETTSLGDIINHIGIGRFHLLIIFITCGGYCAFCCELMVYVFLSDRLGDVWSLTHLQYSLLPFGTNCANIIGGLGLGYMSDRWGRVWSFAISTVFIFVFGLVSVFATNFSFFVVMRVLVNIGIGGALTTLFPTLLEFLPVKDRGRYMTYIILCGTLGATFTAGISWWLVPTYPRLGWRIVLLICAIPSFIILLVRVVFRYESPHFLAGRGELSKAASVLETMASVNGRPLEDIGLSRREKIIEVLCEAYETAQDENKTPITSLFQRRYLRTTLLLSVAFVCQAGGYWGVTLFLPAQLEKLGVDGYFNTFAVFLAEFPGILLVSIIIEWPEIGRLNTFRIFSTMTVCFMALFGIVQNPIATTTFSMLLYFAMVPIFGIMYTYISEVYPTRARSVALAYMNFISSLPGLVTPFVSGYLVDVQLVWLYPAVWAVVYAVQLIAAILLRQETRDIELLE